MRNLTSGVRKKFLSKLRNPEYQQKDSFALVEQGLQIVLSSNFQTGPWNG